MRKVVAALEGAGVEYMVTGSIASSLQGEPRSTHDIDLVVALPREAIGALVGAFPAPDFDFWPLTDSPFDRSRFARRYPEEFLGARIRVSRPEDTILMKLSWAKKLGGSEKQLTDALRATRCSSRRWMCPTSSGG